MAQPEASTRRCLGMDDHERELRRLRLDDRERREEIEAAEAELAAGTRSLCDALVDLGRSGRIVRLDAVDRSRSGRIVHVGEHVVTIRHDAGDDELVSLDHVEGIRSVDETSPVARALRSDDPVRYGHPHSVVASLRSFIGAPVRIERRSTPSVTGRVEGVSDAVAVLRGPDAAELLIPLSSVVSIWQVSADR